MTQRREIAGVARAAFAVAALACGGEDAGSKLDAAALRGKAIYENVCTACHNRDPGAPGVLGPGLAGASEQLLEAKVLRGGYPPGYAPKVPSATMPKYEYLAGKLGDVAAYLATIPASPPPPATAAPTGADRTRS